MVRRREYRNPNARWAKMFELEKICKGISEKLSIKLSYYAENTLPKNAPVCDKQFEGVTDDGEYTYFRFLYRSVGYIGCIHGANEITRNYAQLLPAYIEGFAERETELSKTEHLKRILHGEASTMSIYKYSTKFSVKGDSCFTIALRVPKLMQETLAVLEQYVGNSLDTAVRMTDELCALVRFIGADTEDGYRSSMDYAEFLVQSLKEELGIDVLAGPPMMMVAEPVSDAAASFWVGL